MRGLRIIGKGLRDTFDQLLSYILGSIVWWVVGVAPAAIVALLASVVGTFFWWIVAVIVFSVWSGPALVALFYFTDPRKAVRRPDWRETATEWRRRFRTAGITAFLFGATLAVLILNLTFYADTDSTFAILVPLWLLFIVLTIAVGLTALAVVALTDASIGSAYRRAGYVVASAPFRAVFLVLVATFYVLLGVVTVVPLVMLVPAIIATTLNRNALIQLGIEIPDPNAPTDERVHERQAKKTGKARA